MLRRMWALPRFPRDRDLSVTARTGEACRVCHAPAQPWHAEETTKSLTRKRCLQEVPRQRKFRGARAVPLQEEVPATSTFPTRGSAQASKGPLRASVISCSTPCADFEPCAACPLQGGPQHRHVKPGAGLRAVPQQGHPGPTLCASVDVMVARLAHALRTLRWGGAPWRVCPCTARATLFLARGLRKLRKNGPLTLLQGNRRESLRKLRRDGALCVVPLQGRWRNNVIPGMPPCANFKGMGPRRAPARRLVQQRHSLPKTPGRLLRGRDPFRGVQVQGARRCNVIPAPRPCADDEGWRPLRVCRARRRKLTTLRASYPRGLALQRHSWHELRA